MSDKRPPDKYHLSKVGIDSNVLFTILTGIIITGAPLLILKDEILMCIFTKMYITGSHGYIVTNSGIS